MDTSGALGYSSGSEAHERLPAAPQISVAAVLFLLLHAILIPWGAWRSMRALDGAGELPPPSALYASVLVQQVVLAGLSLLVARLEGIELFPARAPDALALGLALALLGVAVASLPAQWRNASEERRRRLRALTPDDGPAHGLWLVVSLAAGIGEEITYRGVLYAVLLGLGLPPAASVALAALAFGVAHLAQGPRSAAIVVLGALGFHALALASGALYLPMAVHVLYDAIAGVYLGRALRRSAAAS